MLEKYEQYVYAGILGKVIGVYMGRPFEGWRKPRILETFGPIDRYVAPEAGLPIVVPDDDISGTLTFIRALEDSGMLEDTPDRFFGDTWLNYLLENQTILWWGGMGMSTEHTAYLRLKQGYHSPQSGSIQLNGRKVAEQIGAQIFIDAFGLVAPGRPELAATLARKAARVSHDGEAVNAAVVVATMMAAAYDIHDMNQLLDLAVTFIPRDSLIAQVHRDVRAWAREDQDWNLTQKRIEDLYGYQIYGGNCHVIPNHAIMVMAWAYAPDDFHQAQIIVNTAGYDTDCNAGNVGAVMGAMLGLDGICRDYDFRTPTAERIILPTADGTNATTDCWIEAQRIIRLGRQLQRQGETNRADGWMDFAAPGAVHGFQIETDHHDDATLDNPDGRGLRITARNLHLSPLRVSTPVFPQGDHSNDYAIIGTSKLYPGMTVTADMTADHPLTVFPFMTLASPLGIRRIYGQRHDGNAQVSMRVPETDGYPVLTFGLELSSPSPAPIQARITAVNAQGPFAYNAALLPAIVWKEAGMNKRSIPGWITHADRILNSFSDDPDPVRRIVSNEDLAFVYTGNRWWHDTTIKAKLNVHLAEQAGLMACYQGTQRYLSVTRRQDKLVLALQYYGETILDEVTLRWPYDQTRTLKLQTFGNAAIAYLDGAPILHAQNLPITCGAAGCLVKRGNLGLGDLSITGQATPRL